MNFECFYSQQAWECPLTSISCNHILPSLKAFTLSSAHTTVRLADPDDLPGILNLQAQNLKHATITQEQATQGFVTVQHTLQQLMAMQAIEPQVVAVHDEVVVAYLLAMTPALKDELPVLQPMFRLFEHINYKTKKVADYAYIVIGQVCVAKAFRGQGLLHECYAFYQATFSPCYHFAITEIDARNGRSLAAHQRIGFQEIATYSADAVLWKVVIWDWRT